MTGKKVFVSDLGGGGWDISGYISTERWYHGHLHISRYSRAVSKQAENPRAHVIMGGVDTVKFSPDRSVARTRSILYAGRILPHKGINYLVEAVPDGMRLQIIGQAYHKQFFEELRRLARGKDVVFRHECSDDDLVRAYRERHVRGAA